MTNPTCYYCLDKGYYEAIPQTGIHKEYVNCFYCFAWENKDPFEAMEKLLSESDFILPIPEPEPILTDIYAVAARVKNLARTAGKEPNNLTPVGEAMCNLYVHVLRIFYEYAETLPETLKNELNWVISTQEDFPAKVIKAAGQGKNE